MEEPADKSCRTKGGVSSPKYVEPQPSRLRYIGFFDPRYQKILHRSFSIEDNDVNQNRRIRSESGSF